MARRIFGRAPVVRLLLVLILLADAVAARAWSPEQLIAPCENDCAFTIYSGRYVQNSLGQVMVTSPQPPLTWEYNNSDRLIATAFSRTTGGRILWGHVSMEPEIGIGQRYGRQDETEVWAALFFRYHGFPWDKYLVTTVAASTGLNWASDVSEVEQARARDGQGSQLMHFFAPEITLAYPSVPNVQLVLRMHHRSGVFGLVSDAWGGAQYGSVGLRIWF